MAEPVEIPLGHGLVALVDAEDAPRALAKTWHAWRKPGRPDVIYAQHTFRFGPGGRKAKTSAIWLHRFVLSAPDGVLVDHRDGNGLNCRRYNLRECTGRQNTQHVTLSPNQRRGGYKGVAKTSAGRWSARVRGGEAGADGRRRWLYLGTYDTPEAAARAYDAAAVAAFGEFAALNFPAAAGEPTAFARVIAAGAALREAVVAADLPALLRVALFDRARERGASAA